MKTNDFLRSVLLARLFEIKARNPKYSKRKFAADIQVSSGALTEFLDGKRDFNQKTINRIICLLKLTAAEQETHSSQVASSEAQLDFSRPIKVSLSDKGLAEIRHALQKLERKIKIYGVKFRGDNDLEINFVENRNLQNERSLYEE